MINNVEIMGNLASDPEYYSADETGNDVPFCAFNIECTQEIKGIYNTETACFSCIAFNDLAYKVWDNFVEGMPIHLWGNLYMRSWEDRNGDWHTTTDILVQKAVIDGVDKREKNAGGEPIKKSKRELRKHRRAVGILFRETYGAPEWEDILSEDELNTLSPAQRFRLGRQREKEWFEKKGIPNPNDLLSQTEKDSLSIAELDQLLEKRGAEWLDNAWKEQRETTEKNLGRYFLEQRIIPDRLFIDDGVAFIVLLQKKQGGYLISLMNIYENLRIGGGYTCPYQAEQFKILTQRMRTGDNRRDFELVIIKMPEPESVPLCSHLIICHDFTPNHIRYYTVEKALGREHFMLCGVNENGTHLNYGDTPDTFQEIIEKVRELYTRYLSD